MISWASNGSLQDIEEAKKRLEFIKEQEKELLERIKALEKTEVDKLGR